MSMKIVLSLSSYANLTGSELYVHDLATELLRRNHDVTIIANVLGDPLISHTNEKIEIFPFFDHPDIQPDLVISSQPAPTGYSLKTFPHAIHMQVVHSLLAYEEPVIHKDIRKYICVRPEIEAFWITEKPEIKERTTVIWNGVDWNRFNTYGVESPDQFTRLFVGTFDYLRRYVIHDLIEDAQKEKTKLWLVLPENPFGKLPENITVFPFMWSIENLVKKCSETAGIFIGRTTIEGWCCGKPGLVYDVDPMGKIVKKATYGVPKNMKQLDIRVMTEEILKLI